MILRFLIVVIPLFGKNGYIAYLHPKLRARD